MKLSSLVVLAGTVALLAASGAPSAPDRTLYIVLLDGQPLATYGGGIAGLPATNPEVTGDARLDTGSPASVAYLAHLEARHADFLAQAGAALGRSLTAEFRYDAVLNGVAVELSATEAEAVASLSGVRRVVRDFVRQLLTDAGPIWIGANAIWDGSGTGGASGTRGEGIVVGVIDTGVNHDHPSFADPGPVDGFDHSNPKGRFFGACDPLTGAPFCNDKLIGFWDFTGTTPEDTNGHGSHTASTSAGNVVDASFVAPTMTVNKRLSGVAPHANLITYKACITNCPVTAILGSINQATLDEVDVINFSIGSPASSDPWSDLDSLAFRDARAAGVFVSASAGNDGPGAATVGSPAEAPWLTTVGASTHNRKFINSLVGLSGGSSALADIHGKSVTSGHGPAPIVYAGDPPYNSPLCGAGPAAPTGEAAINPFPPGTFDGEIVVCDRGTYGRVEKSQNVMEGGAGGYILANDAASGDSTIADPYWVPGINIGFQDGVRLKEWLASGSGHTGTITGTVIDVSSSHGDVMASFSSRGPNRAVPSVVKPDVTAPGVDVFAAFNTVNPSAPPEWGIISGTSMSSPHNAGAAALVRAVHPEWSPDEVRSALMTTGFTALPGTGSEVHGVLKEDSATVADAFDMGGGRVDLRSAARAGLVLDETVADYIAADPGQGGDPSALNLPSLGSGACAGICQWTRTLKSSAAATVTWTAATTGANGMSLAVQPSSFALAPGATQEVTVTADVRAVSGLGWQFGQVILMPSDSSIPASHLTVAANKVAGQGDPVEQVALYFHGNVHDGCTGVGNVDLALEDPACPHGPTMSTNSELDSEPAAAFASNPALTCAAGFDRCIAEPNWLWLLSEPTEIAGPMTVQFWWGCPACIGAPAGVGLNEDFEIRLFVDGVEVLNQVVRNLAPVPSLPREVSVTVNVPRTIANERVVLRIEPVFVHQREAAIFYDSTQACPGALSGPCDSRVLMPVPVQREPDLVVQDTTASTNRARQGEKVTITATVANTGDADAPASATEFLLDGATVLGTVDTLAIPAGESASVSVDWDTRDVSGEHTIRVTADSGGAVSESAEDNNTGTLTVTVKGNKVRNGSFSQSSGSSPDHWTASGDTSYDGDKASAGPAGSWTSDPIAVAPGASYDMVVSATGSLGTVVVQQLSAAGLVVGSVGLPALGLLDTPVTVGADAAQVRIVLQGGVTGTTFDDVGLFER